MKKNIVKSASKLSVVLVVFLMLTLVFTLYQTSVNSFVVDVVDELNIADVENDPNILQIMPVTADAISSFTYHTFWSSKSMSNTWGSVVEKKETYTATTSLDNDAYKRAGYGNAIKFYAYYSVTASGNGSQSFYVTASGGASSQNTLSMSNSSGTHESSKYNLPGGTTTFTATLTMQTNGKAFTQQTATVTNCRVYLTKADTTAPTISSGTASYSSAYWQTNNSITVSDSGAGINTISVTYTNLSGNTANTSLNFTASGTSSNDRVTSRTLTLPGQGKYAITVTDNVGNSSSKTVWYYDSVVTAVENNMNMGSAFVSTASNSSGSADKVEDLFGTQSYYLYASPNNGYYFQNWSGYGSISAGSCSYVDGKLRTAAQTIPASPKVSSYSWQANFAEIVPLMYNNGTASPSGTTSFSFTYNASQVPLELKVPSGFAGSVTYTGTSLANIAYSAVDQPPMYAGKYVAAVTITCSGTTVGYAEYDLTILAAQVYAKPTFPALIGGIANSKEYDGTTNINQINATDWELGSDTGNNALSSFVGNDKLTFTTISPNFTFANSSVGTGKDITINTNAKITSTRSSDANTNLNIAASYAFNKSTDELKGAITPRALEILSAGYGQCYDGKDANDKYIPISSLKGYYVNNEKITTDLMGKVYDGSNSANFAGIIIKGYLDADKDYIGFHIGDTNGDPYITKTSTSVEGGKNVGYILQSFSGTFANIDAGTNKTVTSTSLYLGGSAKGNYYVSGINGNNATTAYNNQVITLYEEGCAIAQKDVTIAIFSHTNKTYDGNNIASVTYDWAPAESYTDTNANDQYDLGEPFVDVNGNGRWDDGRSPIQKQGAKYDSIYFDGASAIAEFSSNQANYYAGSKVPAGGNGRWFTGESLTITARNLSLCLGDPNDASDDGDTNIDNYHLTSTTTEIYRGASWSQANYDNNTFIAIATRLLNLKLVGSDKEYDGNNNCYEYSWITDEYEGDPDLGIAGDTGKIVISAKVTYSEINVNTVSVTAREISISGKDGDTTYKNYHVKEDATNGPVDVTDENQRNITAKDISSVNVAEIPAVFYKGAKYNDVITTVIDEKLIKESATYEEVLDPTNTSKYFSATLTATGENPDFAFSYDGDFTNTSGVNGAITYEHKVVITGKGNYKGSTYTIFTIKQASVYISGVQNIEITYGEYLSTDHINATTIINKEVYESNTNAVEVNGGWTFDATWWASLDSGKNRPLVSDSNDVIVQFTPTDKWNYSTPDTNSLYFNVLRRPITITAKTQKYTYGDDIKFNNVDLTYSSFSEESKSGLISGDTFGYVNCVTSTMVYDLPALNEDGSYKKDDSGYYVNATKQRIFWVNEYTISNYNANGELTISNDNYDITFEEGSFIITARTIKLAAKSVEKVYGEDDPEIPYDFSSTSNGKVTKALIEGKLSRTLLGGEPFTDANNNGKYDDGEEYTDTNNNNKYDDGEQVSTYYSLGGTIETSVFNNANYNLTITHQPFKITKRVVVIRPTDVLSHYFGEPIIIDSTSYTASAEAGNALSGVASRDNGVALTSLFSVTIVRTIQNQSAALVESTSDLKNAQVGTYDLLPNKVTSSNYNCKVERGKFVIIPRPVLITPDSEQGKLYDAKGIVSSDNFTYTPSIPNGVSLSGSPVVSGYALLGALTRVDGSDARSYLITQGTLNNNNGANPNYEIIFSEEEVYYVISPLEVTITPYPISIKVGSPLPTSDEIGFTTSPAEKDLPTKLAGKLMIEGTPEDVGTYNIIGDAEMLSDANKNYTLIIDGTGAFVIEKLTALITPVEGFNITFGTKFPANFGVNQDGLKYFTIVDKYEPDVDLSHLLSGEGAEFTGALGVDITKVLPKNDGESEESYLTRKQEYLATQHLPVGEYPITIGDFRAIEINGKSNYAVEFIEGAVYTVNKKEIIITINDKKSDGTDNLTKTYDSLSDNGIEYYVDESQLVEGYPIDPESKLERKAGVNAGKYLVSEGNFNKLASQNKNYTFKLVNPDSEDELYYYTIAKREIVVTPVVPEGQDKIYSIYGDAKDAVINYVTHYKHDVNEVGLIGKDTLPGSLARESGKNVTADGYAILEGTLNKTVGTQTANPNYTVTYNLSGIRYYVIRRDIHVTSNNYTQIFGEAPTKINPKYTITDFPKGETALVGNLSREPGDMPGEYKITQGDMTNEKNPNYNVIFTEAKYTIIPRSITLAARNSQKKGYAEADPVFTSYIANGSLVDGYDIKYTLTREKGEIVKSSYAFIFVLDDSWEYNKCYTFEGFATCTNNQAETYGEEYRGKTIYVDPINTFAINMGQSEIGFKDGTVLDEFGNYVLSLEYNGQEQTVGDYLVRGGDEEYVDQNANGMYDEGEEYVDINENGQHDKGVTVNYEVNGQLGINTFKDAGTYIVKITTIANTYYKGSSVEVMVTVKPKDLGTVNPTDRFTEVEDREKIYGDVDKANYSYTYETELGDTITVTMAREEGENVGTYDLVSITIDNDNYKLSFEDGTNLDVFEIKQKPIEVDKVTTVSITYGDNTLTTWTQAVTDNLNNVVTITYTRTDSSNNNAGSYDVASYVIDSTNHVVNIDAELLKGVFVINPKAITIQANKGSKIYDGKAVDLSTLSYTVKDNALVGEDVLNGSLTIIPEGALNLINVGKYKIVADGLDSESNPNYAVEYEYATYEIEPASITVAPVVPVDTYVYGDEIPSLFTYSIVEGELYGEDSLEGTLGANTNKNVGTWAISQGTLDNNEGRNPNYTINYNSSNYVIEKLTIKIKVDSASQVYGDPMPTLEYEFVDGTALIEGDELHGTLSSTGKTVGKHQIVTSDDFMNDNPNYNVILDNEEAWLTITVRPLVVTPDNDKTSVYGEATVALTYTTDNLVEGDVLEGELGCNIGTDAGSYPITLGTLKNDNYTITLATGTEFVYVVTPREVTITINNAESEFGTEDAPLTYSITKGNLIGNDDLEVVLERESGTAMGFYKITGTWGNTNYNVNIIDAVYTIKKFQAVINVENQYISFVEDGNGRSISASCTSGAEIFFSIDFEEVHNFFKTAGKYVVVLTAPETESYYAPEPVTIYITINRAFIQSEANGIDIKLETENGFDPSLSVEMSRLPIDFEEIQAELKSNQKIVRAFSLTTTSDQASSEQVPGKTTITIKVPNSLKEEQVVQVMVQEDGVYNLVEVDVIDGYVTLEVDSLSNFAFIAEESNNYLVIIIIGVAALIMLGSVMVFLFRKRS